MNDHSSQEVKEYAAGAEPYSVTPPNWREVTVPISQLRPFEKNPRTITETQFVKLKASLIRNGQFRPLLATMDFRLAGGHQRIRAMQELGHTEVRVSVPDIDITDDQYMELVLLDNHSNGLFDMDMLASMFDEEYLRALGLHEMDNIPPMGVGGEEPKQAGMVRCPSCACEFPTKGNKV